MNIKDFVFTYFYLMLLGALVLLFVLMKLFGGFCERKWRCNTVRFHPLALVAWLLACGVAIVVSVWKQHSFSTVACAASAVVGCVLYFAHTHVRYNEKEIKIYGIYGECQKIPYEWILAVYPDAIVRTFDDCVSTKMTVTVVYRKGGHADDVGEAKIRTGWHIGSSRLLSYVSSRILSTEET